MMEALYVVEFGDILSHAYRNGGVAVLETGRIFGGDSGFYYLGTYTTESGRITAHVDIVNHNPAMPNVFGTSDKSSKVILRGEIGEVISGEMELAGRGGPKLPVRLTWKADLP